VARFACCDRAIISTTAGSRVMTIPELLDQLGSVGGDVPPVGGEPVVQRGVDALQLADLTPAGGGLTFGEPAADPLGDFGLVA